MLSVICTKVIAKLWIWISARMHYFEERAMTIMLQINPRNDASPGVNVAASCTLLFPTGKHKTASNLTAEGAYLRI